MKRAAIFLPSVALTPPLELTICHAQRLVAEGHELITLEFGRDLIRSQFNQHGNLLMHAYTLARQKQFCRFVQPQKQVYFRKSSSRYFFDLDELIANDKSAYLSVMSTLASRFRITEYDQLPLVWQDRFPYLVQSYHCIFDNTVKAIKSENISLLGVFNGRFFDSAAVVNAAKSMEISYFVYDVNRSSSQYYFYNTSLHSIKANQEKVLSFYDPNNLDHTKCAHEYFLKRRSGKRTYEKSYTAGQKRGYLPKGLLNKKIIAVYPSSDDEYRFLVDESIYKCVDQASELSGFCDEFLKANSDYLICIRLHPNMAEMHPNALNKYHILSDYTNVYIANPLDDLDTYALLDAADIVVGFCSSIILESAYIGKKTLLIGPSLYRGMGLGDEFESGLSAASFILNDSRFTIPSKNSAMMWATYVNLYNDPLPSFSIEAGSAKVNSSEISPPRLWRLLSAVAKLYYELTESKSSSLTTSQKFRHILNRCKSLLRNKWT